MRRTLLIAIALGGALTLSAQNTVRIEDSGADEIVRIWDNSTAPHSNFETEDEVLKSNRKFWHTSELALYIYHADPTRATGQAVVMFPGGSYHSVNFSYLIVRQLQRMGVTVAIAKYRLPNRGHYLVPLEDAVRSVRYMRENAGRLGIDPAKVGVAGDSAGGHLASWVSNSMPGEEPAFAILVFPACIRSEWYIASTGPINLMGPDLTPALAESLNTPSMVTASTPRTLILHSDDDRVVHPFSSTEYYKALKRHGVPATMHIYPSGKHGWLGKKDFRYIDQWQGAVADFITICNCPQAR